MLTRLTPSFKVHFKNISKGICTFYGCILGLFLIELVFYIILGGESQSQFSGLDFISAISIFVFGITCFRPNLKISFANCVSRKTEFVSTTLSAFVYTFIMTFINGGMILLFSTILKSESIFDQAYANFEFANGLIRFLAWFLYGFLMLSSSFACGYFIGALYYRMNKVLKIAVSVGVPAMFFIIMPLMAGILGINNIFVKTLISFINFIVSTMANPFGAILIFLLFTMLCEFFSFLLIRKAPIKEQ